MATAWRGLFSSFEEAISEANYPIDPWKDKKWIKYTPRKREDHLDSPFPVVVDALSKYGSHTLWGKRGPLIIVDIGGNTGSHYDLIKQYNIRYNCIDNNKVCKIGKELNPDVVFFPSLNHYGAMSWLNDIIYLNSTLQYINDWKFLIKDLNCFAPDYFIFERLSVTTNPTFVTLQTDMEEYEVPYRFINEKEFIDTFLSINSEYQLIYKCKSESLNDRLDGLDWPVFTSNLIFVRK